MCLALFARNVKPDLDLELFWLTLAYEELMQASTFLL